MPCIDIIQGAIAHWMAIYPFNEKFYCIHVSKWPIHQAIILDSGYWNLVPTLRLNVMVHVHQKCTLVQFVILFFSDFLGKLPLEAIHGDKSPGHDPEIRRCSPDHL